MRIHYLIVFNEKKSQFKSVKKWNDNKINKFGTKSLNDWIYYNLSQYVKDEDLCLLHTNYLINNGETVLKNKKNNRLKYSFEYSYFDKVEKI